MRGRGEGEGRGGRGREEEEWRERRGGRRVGSFPTLQEVMERETHQYRWH